MNSTRVNTNTITRSVLSVLPSSARLPRLKTWKILFTDYGRPLNTFLDSFRASHRPIFLRIEFSIILKVLPPAGVPNLQDRIRTRSGG